MSPDELRETQERVAANMAKAVAYAGQNLPLFQGLLTRLSERLDRECSYNGIGLTFDELRAVVLSVSHLVGTSLAATSGSGAR